MPSKQNRQLARNNLRYERQKRGWSRKYIAEQMGVAVSTIGQWERGQHIPYPELLQKLCALFGMSVEALGLVRLNEDTPYHVFSLKEVNDTLFFRYLYTQGQQPIIQIITLTIILHNPQ